jgi:hypothetical protein
MNTTQMPLHFAGDSGANDRGAGASTLGVLIAIAVGSLLAGFDGSVSNGILRLVATTLHTDVPSKSGWCWCTCS